MKKGNKLYTELTEAIIALLESQTLSWDKPWIVLDGFGGMARNASSGRMYSMVNQILLGMSLKNYGFTKNAWLTFKQIEKLGGTVKKDQKASTIYFNTYTWKDGSGKKYSWEEVKQMSQEERDALDIRNQYFLTAYYVFNIAQTESLPEIYYQSPTAHQTVHFEVEVVVASMINAFGHKHLIQFKEVDKAFYDVKNDCIVIPLQAQFKSEAGYYGTLFHEWIHWTGHESRLNRPTLINHSKEDYAHEELVAELGSVFICAQLGLQKDMSQNAAYLQSWLGHLQENPRYIMKVITQAEKACKYILKTFSIEEARQEFTTIEHD